MESVLVASNSKLLSSTSLLVKCRYALLMGYYADNMGQSGNSLFYDSICFIVRGIGSKGENKVLALQCIDTMKKIINDKDVIKKVTEFLDQLIETLCAMIMDIDISSFFDILMLVITTYSRVINKPVILMLNYLAKRVSKEMQTLKSTTCKSNIIVTGCWNVIRAIIEQDAFYPVLADEMEKELYPLINYIETPEQIEFDDDIMQVITTIVKKREKLTPELYRVFPYFDNFYRKYKGVFGDLLSTLNTFMYYGRDILSANIADLETVKYLVDQEIWV